MEGDSGKHRPKLPLCDVEEQVEGDGDGLSPTPDNQCSPGTLEVQDYLGQTSTCAGLCTCVHMQVGMHVYVCVFVQGDDSGKQIGLRNWGMAWASLNIRRGQISLPVCPYTS